MVRPLHTPFITSIDPFEVITENQKKLEARYGEQFEVQRSEVRKDGDL